MKISVNKFIINKNLVDAKNPEIARQWEVVLIRNSKEFYNNIIKKGFASCGAVFNSVQDTNNSNKFFFVRRTERFNYSSCFYIDIDSHDANVTTIEHVLQFDFIKKHAWFITTSSSHTDAAPRFHVYFKFDKEIDNAHDHTFIAANTFRFCKFLGISNIDDAVKDPARMAFGNTNALYFLVDENNTISKSKINALINELDIDEHETRDYHLNFNQSLTPEHVDYLVSIIDERLDYDTWIRLIAAVANYLNDDDLSEDILTRYHPDFGSQTTRYKIKTRLKNIGIGTLIRLSTAYFVKKTLNISLQQAFADYKDFKQFFREHLYSKFPDMQPAKKNDVCIYYEVYDAKLNKYKINIDKFALYDFLKKKGFAFLQNSDSRKNAELIFINKGIAQFESIDSLRNHFTSDEGFFANEPEQVTENCSKTELFNALRTQIPNFISEKNISFLPYLRLNFLRDTKHISYFTFRNGVVVVTADDITLRPYSDFNDVVFWHEKIRHHDFFIPKKNPFRHVNIYSNDFNVMIDDEFLDDYQFFAFLQKLATSPSNRSILYDVNVYNQEFASGFDVNRFRSLISGLGYILSNFKDPANAKVVIVTEVTKSDKAEGRTGKSLLWKFIKLLRKELLIDGKTIKSGLQNPFFLQNVSQMCDYINLNDADKYFDLENLYSMITEDMPVQRKYQDAYVLPFKYAPKWVVSTNYPPANTNDSDKARRHIIELDRFFNKDNEPSTFFNYKFFDTWNQRQWNAFYYTCFWIVQQSIRNNHKLYDYETDTLKIGQLRTRTSDSFVNFMLNEFQLNRWYHRQTLQYYYANYEGIPRIDKSFSIKFGMWLKIFASIYGYYYISKKVTLNKRDYAIIISTTPNPPETDNIIFENTTFYDTDFNAN